MTAEASLPVPEAVTTEILTAETFSRLLWEARSLHYGAHTAESYGGLEVMSHTDARTVMVDEERGGATQFVIEDVPSQGVLLRICYSRKDAEHDLLAGEEILLLNSFSEVPRMHKIPFGPAFTATGRLGSYPPHMLVQTLLTEGAPLDENTAEKWLKSILGLTVPQENRPEAETRQNRTAGMMQRLLHRQTKQV